MSLHEYQMSQRMSLEHYPFYALIMAAMRQADDQNVIRLAGAWPKVWKELKARHNAPGGVLPEDKTA